MAATSGSRVVIVGGGFGGLFAARQLKAALQVTLIDRVLALRQVPTAPAPATTSWSARTQTTCTPSPCDAGGHV